MGDPVGLRVEGGRQLRTSVRNAVGDLKDLKDAHKEAADLVARESRPAAPHRTGRLAGSVRSAGTAGQAIIRAGGARIPYAGPIHFGWAARHIKPQPFITETAQRTEPQWTEMYHDAVQNIVDKIKGI